MTVLDWPKAQRWLGGHLLCRVAGAADRFALTFDDGPSPRNTPGLLDTLARHDARATFFLISRRARRHGALVRQIVAGGHEAGIHGDLHVPAWSMPRAWLERDLDAAVAAVRDACGATPLHYRPPFGLLFPRGSECVRARGLIPVLGNVYPRDFRVRRPETIAARVLGRLEPGCIVILHDSSAFGDPDRSATIAAVDLILDAAARRGMRSVPVAELAGGRGPPSLGPT